MGPVPPITVQPPKSGVYPQRVELRVAFEYLNTVRGNPAAFAEEMLSDYTQYLADLGVIYDDGPTALDLSDVEPRGALLWNLILAEVAQAKCEDMFDRDYFAHVDPDGEGINIQMHRGGYTLPETFIRDARSNYFESIALFYIGKDGQFTDAELVARSLFHIQDLIIDRGVPSLGHRKHLLGIGNRHRRHRDIGIGLAVRGLDTHICVIIAHR